MSEGRSFVATTPTTPELASVIRDNPQAFARLLSTEFDEALREAWDEWWDERLREALEGEPGEEPAGLFGDDANG